MLMTERRRRRPRRDFLPQAQAAQQRLNIFWSEDAAAAGDMKYAALCQQGELVPSKISGVGTNFGLLVHVLPGPNKRFVLKRSMVLS